MKRFIITLLMIFALISISAYAESYSFEGEVPSTVTSTLEDGGEPIYADGFIGSGLELDGSYGLSLGPVGSSFTISAMVNISSGGQTQTVFFKNMGSKEIELWTGIIYNNGTPQFWTSGWNRMATTASDSRNKWVFLVYTEDNGTGSLYVDGELVSTGDVSDQPGELYLGTTYWAADAPKGLIDEVAVYDYALSQEELVNIMNEQYMPTLFAKYVFPSSLLITDLDLSAVPGTGAIDWVSDNEAVLSSTGVINRQAEDTTVTLTGTLTDVTQKFTFTVLKAPKVVNDDFILSYDFTAAQGNILSDISGNGNDALIYGGMTGGNFDGTDDYVELPKGVLNGRDEFSIVMWLTPWMVTTHQFTFCFGSGAEEYFFLNTSRPGTNSIRLAITQNGYWGEQEVFSTPGLPYGQYAMAVITVSGSKYDLYVNGLHAASGDIGITVSDLGKTTINYIAKSPFDDPYFRGRIEEFTIYPYVLDAEDIYDAAMERIAPESLRDEDYIAAYGLGPELTVALNRDCIVAASLFDPDGKLIYATTKKASEDDLTIAFDAAGAASAKIAAFDAATGIVKDKRKFSFYDGLFADPRENGIMVHNFNNEAVNAIVAAAVYSGDELTGLDIVTVSIESNSFVTIPLEIPEGSRLLIWKAFEVGED